MPLRRRRPWAGEGRQPRRYPRSVSIFFEIATRVLNLALYAASVPMRVCRIERIDVRASAPTWFDGYELFLFW